MGKYDSLYDDGYDDGTEDAAPAPSAPAPKRAKYAALHEDAAPRAPAQSANDNQPAGTFRKLDGTTVQSGGPNLSGSFQDNIASLVGHRIDREDMDRGPVETFLRKGSQAVSSGFANPIAAKIASKISGQPYDEALRGINASDAAAEARNPVAGAAGTVAGTGLQLAAPLPIPKGTSTLGKIGHTAVAGATLGAAAGAGNALTAGGDASDAVVGGAQGAAVGGLAGTGLGLATQAVPALARGAVARSAAREPGALKEALMDVEIPHGVRSAIKAVKPAAVIADEAIAAAGRAAGIKPYSLTPWAGAPPRVAGEVVPGPVAAPSAPPVIDVEPIPQGQIPGRPGPRLLGPAPIPLGPISDTGGIPTPVAPEITAPIPRQSMRDLVPSARGEGVDLAAQKPRLQSVPDDTASLERTQRITLPEHPGWSRNARGTGYNGVDTTPADTNAVPRVRSQAQIDAEDARFAKQMGKTVPEYRELLATRAANQARDRALAQIVQGAQRGVDTAELVAQAEAAGLDPVKASEVISQFAKRRAVAR